jgi:hypothetical protein
MHVGAQRGTEIQIQLTRKVTPKRPNRLKPVRRAYTIGHGILGEATDQLVRILPDIKCCEFRDPFKSIPGLMVVAI